MADRITYLGHATLLLELGGQRLLTDPLLTNRVLHLYRRSPQISPETYQDIDAVLISHNHWDHLDLPSLRRVGRQTPLIVPEGVGPMLRRRGFAEITELRAGEIAEVGPLGVRATPAKHVGGRPLISVATRSLGFIIEGRKNIYFPGDTDLFPEMVDVGTELDVALMPIAGWGPTLGDGHLDPKQAAEALTMLRPRAAIPIHWGTFYPLGFRRLGSATGSEPAERFRQHAAEIAPDVEVHIVPPGESFTIDA